MAGFHTDVQTLLQDLSHDYGETADDYPSLPYSRPNSNGDYLHVSRSMAPEQTPAPLYDQQLRSATQVFRLSDTNPHHIHNNVGLDAYGKFKYCKTALEAMWLIGVQTELFWPSHHLSPRGRPVMG